MDEESVVGALTSQVLASLLTLKDCIDRCPDSDWNERHGDYPFSQVAFHTLFFCDYYLSDPDDDFRSRPFHLAHRDEFADYEELEDRLPVRLYAREFLARYTRYCLEKAGKALEGKCIEELTAPRSDVRRTMTRLERTVDLARHIQHHAAQLGFRLQILTGTEMPWHSRGTRR